MNCVLLDTCGYSALWRGDRSVAECVASADLVYLPLIVAGELMVGFRGGSQLKRNLEQLRQFRSRPTVKTVGLTWEIADRYSVLLHHLRSTGRLIPQNDIWIAAQALELNAALITSDTHFEAIGGLRVVW